MMDQMKDLLALQKKAQAIQEKLGNTHIEADEGDWTVVINGKQECVDVLNKGISQPTLVKALNKALKKSQEIAANEMKGVMGDLGLTGAGKMDQMKDMLALQAKAQEIQDKLANTHIEADEAEWTVIINGKQDCVDILQEKKPLPAPLKAIAKALKKSQEIAANEMKNVMGNLGLPGLGK